MALAISDILFNSSGDGNKIVLVVPQGGTLTSKNPCIQPHQCSKIELRLNGESDVAVIYNLVKMYLSLFS